MGTNTLTTVLLTAALLGVGFSAGLLLSPEPDAPEPIVLRAPAAPSASNGPELGAAPEGDDRAEVLRRLTAIEQALRDLRAEQGKLAASMEPAAALVDLLDEARPKLESARRSANETAAIATLRNLTSAQAQFQASGKADTDSDGTGEYGGFLELSGAAAGRMASVLVPPVLSRAFRRTSKAGEVVRSGYVFRIYLPDPRGRGEGETATGFADDGRVDPDLAETTWCCYAWPVDGGRTGARTFFANQAGDILATEDGRYAGPDRGPDASAAFTMPAITGATAIGRRGGDGNVWQQVN